MLLLLLSPCLERLLCPNSEKRLASFSGQPDACGLSVLLLRREGGRE